MNATEQLGQAEASRTFVTEAYATVDDIDSPDYCAFKVNEAFFARLAGLVALCEEHKLTELRVGDAPELWGPIGIEDQARLRTYEMVVMREGTFYFSSAPKDSAGFFESRSMKIEELVEKMNLGSGDVVFFDEGIKGLYMDDQSDAEDGDETEGEEHSAPAMRGM